MKFFLSIFLLTFYVGIQSQSIGPITKLANVKAGNNQIDSSFVNIDLLQKQPINLNFDQNYIYFNFVNSKDSLKKSFSYNLKGLDYSWIKCDNCSEVIYAHLDGGDYTFKIKTDEPGDIPLEFQFSISGNVLHKWWFVPMLFLYVLIFIGVVIYLFILYEFREKIKHQAQVHKEKLNSMGELTSGIAHEIQNPLNFVNNFSEISIEIANDLKKTITSLKSDDFVNENLTEAQELIDDLITNQEKINLHGKRAADIVKGMLEHSKKSTGEKVPTNINVLCDEYLRLSYHGFSTKNKTNNIDFQFIADENLPKINVIPQDIGRVLLNILNNAFWAANEKRKKNVDGYQPQVTISTLQISKAQVRIAVMDNGLGIPDHIRGKIFQPFFTTKPTGDGVGLGLSLSYDIIISHGGDLNLETKEGEGSTFFIYLPITTS